MVQILCQNLKKNVFGRIQIWLDLYQYKGQGRIFEKCGTKISKKNNLKQKSYEDFSVLKINKSTKKIE